MIKLFNDYATFDNSRQQNGEGIGLGLSLCQSLIRLMGFQFNKGPLNRIEVQSEINRGTRFGFLMNIKEEQFFTKNGLVELAFTEIF